MSNSDNSADLSMEEILASIRKIVSEEPEQSPPDGRPMSTTPSQAGSNLQPPASDLSDILEDPQLRGSENSLETLPQGQVTWPKEDLSTSTPSSGSALHREVKPEPTPPARSDAFKRSDGSRPTSNAVGPLTRDTTRPISDDRPTRGERLREPANSPSSTTSSSASHSARQEPPFVNRLRELATGYSSSSSPSDTKHPPSTLRTGSLPLRDEQTRTSSVGSTSENNPDPLLPGSRPTDDTAPQGSNLPPNLSSAQASKFGAEKREEETLERGDRPDVWQSRSPLDTMGLAARGTKPAFGVAAASGSAPVEVSIEAESQAADIGRPAAAKFEGPNTAAKRDPAAALPHTQDRGESASADRTRSPLTTKASLLNNPVEEAASPVKAAASSLSSAQRNEVDRARGKDIRDVPTPGSNGSNTTETKLEAALIELVRPIVHDWLEANGPALIEKAVKGSAQKSD